MDAAVVAIHGQRAGWIERLSEFYDFRFRFDPEWLADARRATLGQLFLDRMPQDIVTSGFPCWFAHLLPQGPARRLLQRWSAVDEDEDDDFDLLLAIGGDLPGAIALQPGVRPPLSDPAYAPSLAVEPGKPTFTLPGAQYKLSVAAGERGLVVPTRGELGAYIAKFHDPSFPGLQHLEYATTEWARQAGIRCHETRMVSTDDFDGLPDALPTGDGHVFLAARFDRSSHGPIHVEDFGQVLDVPPGQQQYSGSYEMVGRVIALLCPEDLLEYVDRLAFMIVSGNGDAHLKNWGIIYPDRRRPRLGPAYDLVAVAARLPRDDLALQFGGQKAFGSIDMDTFGALARHIGLTEAEVVERANRARERALDIWAERHLELPFTDTERELMACHHRRTPFCRGQ